MAHPIQQFSHFWGGFRKDRKVGKELLVSTIAWAGDVLITYLPPWKDFLYVIQVDAISILEFPFSKPVARRKQTKSHETSLEAKLIFYYGTWGRLLFTAKDPHEHKEGL